MIEVKGTRTDETANANPRDRYVFGDAQSLTKAPMFVMTLIAGVVAYLKVALARPDSESRERPEAAPEKVAKSTPTPKEEEAQSSGGRQFDPEQPEDRDLADILPFPARPYRLVDSAPLDYAIEPYGVRGRSPAVAPGGAPAGNDNGSAPGSTGGGAPPSPAGPADPGEFVPHPGGPVPQGPKGPKRNTAPTAAAPVLLSDLFVGQVVLITSAHLLAGATDLDGDALGIKNLAVTGGTLEARADGWIFRSSPDAALGEVKITYEISDGTASVRQMASFQLLKTPPITGTEAADVLLGTERADEILGLGGSDIIDARGGNDTVLGGAGDDHIVAGAGDDLVLAGAGDDVVFGGRGNDFIDGGAGNDRLYGEAGDDLLYGEAGDDTLSGGDGSDVLFGGAGKDVITDGNGRDRVIAGEGDDRVLASLDGADDVFDGGAGEDMLDLTAAASSVAVDLAAGSASGEELGHDTVLHFELIRGGAGDDTLDGDDKANVLFGGAGDDTIAGRGGDDHLYGGSGSDTLDLSGTGLGVLVDLVAGTASGAEIGRDTIASFETFIGGDGDDVFKIGEMEVTLVGGLGDDEFYFDVQVGEGVGRAELVHQIMDFVVGDQIHVSDYEIRRSGRDGADRFEKYRQTRDDPGAAPDAGADDGSIRIRYEAAESRQVAIIEVDTNFDTSIDLTIRVYEHTATVEFTV
jgi:Ca2+-binding RTX toxin-like protein